MLGASRIAPPRRASIPIRQHHGAPDHLRIFMATRQICHNQRHSSSSSSRRSSSNPLEQLRSTLDPQARAALMQRLDSSWSAHAASYCPSELEQMLNAELGIPQYTIMLWAVQKPQLQGSLDPETQARPAVRSLTAAGISSQDAWFLVTRRPELLSTPLALQRWLDFLLAQDASSPAASNAAALAALKQQQAAQVADVRPPAPSPQDLLTFLLRAPAPLLAGEGPTLAQAGAIIAFLRRLGIKREFLVPRVVCLRPEVLGRDAAAQLQPLVASLLRLGIEAGDVGRLACVWPDLLLCDPDAHIAPLVAHCRGLGCSTSTVAALLQEAPQILQTPGGPEAWTRPRLAALAELAGVSSVEDVARIVGGSAAFLIAKDAPRAQLEALRGLGLGPKQLRAVALGCPDALSEKPLELERKVQWLQEELDAGVADAAAHPAFLGASLMQVTGPRHAFARSKGVLHKLGRRSSAGGGGGGGGGGSSDEDASAEGVSLDLTALVSDTDAAWCEALGRSINEYEGSRTEFEQRYTEQLSVDAALEFQQELKKLGIYEGARAQQARL